MAARAVVPVLRDAGCRDYFVTYCSEAADILRATHGAEFPALSGEDWAGMARALYREVDGRLVADFDPAIAEQFRAADLSQPLPDLWAQFALLVEKPVMVVRGEFSRLLSRESPIRK